MMQYRVSICRPTTSLSFLILAASFIIRVVSPFAPIAPLPSASSIAQDRRLSLLQLRSHYDGSGYEGGENYYSNHHQSYYDQQATDRVLNAVDGFRELTETTFAEQRVEMDSILQSLRTIQQQAETGANGQQQQQQQQEHHHVPLLQDDNLMEATPPPPEEEEDGFMMSGPTEVECDVCIVGGGPAGCTCALYTARADLNTVIVDKNPATGALAITSHIANYPGVDKTMTGEELLGLIRQQAIEYGADYRRAQVFLIDVVADETGDNNNNNLYMVYTPDVTFKARALVLATGAMGRVSPPFPGEDTFLGQGVSYCATCDGAFYRDAEVAVKGMNLEAMEEASFLTKFAKTVHWVTPHRPRPSDNEQVQELLASGNVKKWQLTRLLSVEGDPVSGVTGIQVKQKNQEEPEIIPVEGVFIYAGGAGGSKPITDYVDMGSLGKQIQYKEDGGVVVNEGMETNVQGVFAIGDIRNTSYKQVVVAAADGCIAAMSIDKYLKGRKNVKVDWIHK